MGKVGENILLTIRCYHSCDQDSCDLPVAGKVQVRNPETKTRVLKPCGNYALLECLQT